MVLLNSTSVDAGAIILLLILKLELTMAHASQRVPNSNQNTSKTHRTLISTVRVRKRAAA